MTPRARKAPASRAATFPTADALPHLAEFLDGYLHQDFTLDYETAGDALRAFLAECNDTERLALSADSRRFAEAAAGRSWRDVRRAFSALGGGWLPKSRQELDALLAAATGMTQGRASARGPQSTT